jgi:hypothetical protein
MDTESVKIRINKITIALLKKTATEEYRTFQDQCRMILDEWAKSKEKK